MDSRKLSARSKQPGHDLTFRAAEGNFAAFLRARLDPEVFEITDKPKDLLYMLPNPGVKGARPAYGIVPEVA